MNSVKILKFFIIATFFTFFIGACGVSYVEDRIEKGKVVNAWMSGSTQVIYVKVDTSLIEIEDTYFGSLSPKIGDCVGVWVRIYKERPFGPTYVIPIGGRNISSCE